MANTNAPFGLRPVRHLFGGVIRESAYTIADQYGTGLFMGDPVVATGTGKNIQIATAATADAKVTGVFQGCKFVDANGDTKFMNYWPAGQVTKNAVGAEAIVIDDPFVEFEIQFSALVAADIRALANLASGSGSTSTGLSAWTATQPPGSTENQLKIVGLSNTAGIGGAPNAYGAYAVGRVLINTHEFHYKAESGI